MVTRYGRGKRTQREGAFKHIPRITEMDAISENAVLDGRVQLLQPERGYRAGLDAALLAAACDAQPGERVLEVGCGVGGALLAAAARRPQASFLGVERSPEALELARRNIALNGLAERVHA